MFQGRDFPRLRLDETRRGLTNGGEGRSMHNAAHRQSVAAAMNPLTPPSNPPRLRISTFDTISSTAGDHETEVILGPAGTFTHSHFNATDQRNERRQQLAIAIRQRIETRLVGRVRDLAVRIKGDTIVLEGSCATYYTKQLAQHAALGVLEDEQLENAIVVEHR
jgi:hypothetical protein